MDLRNVLDIVVVVMLRVLLVVGVLVVLHGAELALAVCGLVLLDLVEVLRALRLEVLEFLLDLLISAIAVVPLLQPRTCLLPHCLSLSLSL